MNFQLSRMAWSIAFAVILVCSISIVVLVVFVIGRSDEIAEEIDVIDTPLPPETGCTFSGVAGDLTVYAAPFEAPSQARSIVLGGVDYPVLRQHDDMYLVELPSGETGWMRGENGTLQGDCDDIPQDDQPLSAYPSVCAVQTESDVTLYADLDLLTEIQTLSPGTYYVEAIENDRYFILLDEETGGWMVPPETSQLHGACDGLVNPPA